MSDITYNDDGTITLPESYVQAILRHPQTGPGIQARVDAGEDLDDVLGEFVSKAIEQLIDATRIKDGQHR